MLKYVQKSWECGKFGRLVYKIVDRGGNVSLNSNE